MATNILEPVTDGILCIYAISAGWRMVFWRVFVLFLFLGFCFGFALYPWVNSVRRTIEQRTP